MLIVKKWFWTLYALALLLPAQCVQQQLQVQSEEQLQELQEAQEEQQTEKPAEQRLCSIKATQQKNINILTETLEQGWHAFCDAPVDEGIMSLFNGINPSDASIYLMTANNQTIELPIKHLGEVADYDIDPKRKTLVYVNAFFMPHSYFSVHEHLKLLQQKRRDLNIIVIDFAKNIEQLYYTIRHHMPLQSYFVYKVLNVLREHGVAATDITLVGHSVGANIAALSAYLLTQENSSNGTNATKVGQLIAIDPAIMCQPSDIHVRANVSERVVVIHGENHLFGINAALGTIDIYPNGVGYLSHQSYQPGCDTKLCSHTYPFLLFMEALVEGVMIPAVQCNSWFQFRLAACQYDDTIAVGIKYPERAKGLYFCMTQSNPPFTYMEHGLKYRKKSMEAIEKENER